MTSIILCFNKHQLTQVHLENDRDDNWTIGVISRAKQIITTNKLTSSFLQAGCPSCRPTNNVKALKGKYHIPWTCLPQAHLRVFQLCLRPLIAPGYLGGGLQCLLSALWCQYPKSRHCIYTRRKIRWFPKCYSFRSAMKSNEFIAEKIVSEQWRHQALVDAWPSWIDARCQYVLLVLSCKDAEKVNYSS